MPRPKEDRTEVLYVRISLKNRTFVREQRSKFKSESNFINKLLTHARVSVQAKNNEQV